MLTARPTLKPPPGGTRGGRMMKIGMYDDPAIKIPPLNFSVGVGVRVEVYWGVKVVKFCRFWSLKSKKYASETAEVRNLTPWYTSARHPPYRKNFRVVF